MGFFKLIAILGVAAAVMQPAYSATIANPCICTLEFMPLCGSDGQTYANKCEFNCAKKLNRNLEVFSQGECVEVQNLPANDEAPVCACPFILDPICGSDGQTYSNECEFNCNKKLNRNLEIFAKGECVEVSNLPANDETDVPFCTMEYMPLCGSDGQTYANKCIFKHAKKLNRNLEVYSAGECNQIQNLPAEEKMAKIQNLPAKLDDTPCICPFINDPVCGSDGQTYSNDCEFNCAKKFNRNLEIFSKGECIQISNLPANDEPLCACPFILDPLCGSDGQTYSNECVFNCNKKLNRNLEIFARGECIKIENLPLTKH